MDPLFELTDELATPIGASPFRCRGIFYDQLIKHSVTLKGGTPNYLAQIRDPQVRQFMSQKFRWMEWYDALPSTPAQVALCRAEGGEFETLVRARARKAAESLVPRMFRVALGMGNPKLAAEHLPRLLAHNYDFANMSVEVTGNEGFGTLHNLPRVIAPGFVNIVLGLIDGTLRLMGAKSVTCDYSNVRAGPPLHGFETITCDLHTRWVK